jgi:hypothetical protein
MNNIKVELQDVIINGYGKGTVLEMLADTASRLIEQGLVTEVSGDTPFIIKVTANNGKVPVITMLGNTVKVTH